MDSALVMYFVGRVDSRPQYAQVNVDVCIRVVGVYKWRIEKWRNEPEVVTAPIHYMLEVTDVLCGKDTFESIRRHQEISKYGGWP